MNIDKRQNEVLTILKAIGFPMGDNTEFSTPLRQKRVANILMGVANLRPDQDFSEIFFFGDGNNFAPRTRDLIRFINKHYGEAVADSSYDDVRRKNLDFLVEAELVVKAANKPGAATNDGTRGYAIAATAIELFRQFGKPGWSNVVWSWTSKTGRLSDKLARPRMQRLVPVKLPNGSSLDGGFKFQAERDWCDGVRRVMKGGDETNP